MVNGDRMLVLDRVGTLFRVGTLAGLGDGQLLERFLACRDDGEAAELAFATLVERHGPMVLRVCRRRLKDRDDADDAFQATFLALVRGAPSIRSGDSLACWLHGAALRVSACARSAGARRRVVESAWAARRPVVGRDAPADDLGAVLHEEIGRLPGPYRAALVLCDLQGLSQEQAARDLGCPVGTVKSRLARGRDRLKARLTRRGLAPAAVGAGLALAREAGATVSPTLARAAVRLAVGVVDGTGILFTPAAWLARLDQGRLLVGRIRSVALGLATLGALAAGATLLAQGPAKGRPGASDPARRPDDVVEVYTFSYPIADLLDAARDKKQGPADPEPLMELIAASVSPGTWADRVPSGRRGEGDGGIGTIRPSADHHYLAIRQTPAAHVQIHERLDQLRRLVGIRPEPAARAALEVQQMLDRLSEVEFDRPDQERARFLFDALQGLTPQDLKGMEPPRAEPASPAPPPAEPPARLSFRDEAEAERFRAAIQSGLDQLRREQPAIPRAVVAEPERRPQQPYEALIGALLGGAEAQPGKAVAPRADAHPPAAPADPARGGDGAQKPGPTGAKPASPQRGKPGPASPWAGKQQAGPADAPPTPPAEDATGRRLRALEEKLDRVLKALDGPKQDTSRKPGMLGP